MKKLRRLFLATAALGALTACGGGGGGVSAAPAPAPAPTAPAAPAPAPTPAPSSLSVAYKDLFRVGAAVTPAQVAAADRVALMQREFNVLVAENVMKPSQIGKADGVYDFSDADKIVNFAKANGMKVRGHTLVWHQQQADWMFKNGSGPGGAPTAAELTTRLQKYIADVIGHFKSIAPGVVYAWDVVNEAFVPDEAGVPQVGGWRKSNLYDILGPQFIDIAFAAAAKADPDALLFYNDYGTESPAKRALILTLIDSLKAKGIAIHGVGHQAHYAMNYPADWTGLEQSIVAVSAKTNSAGQALTNHITELDIALNPGIMDNTITSVTPALLDAQALRYKGIYQMFLSNRSKVSAVLTWGIDDDTSWLRTWPVTRLEAPLLFDGKLGAKPAYIAVEKLGREFAR